MAEPKKQENLYDKFSRAQRYNLIERFKDAFTGSKMWDELGSTQKSLCLETIQFNFRFGDGCDVKVVKEKDKPDKYKFTYTIKVPMVNVAMEMETEENVKTFDGIV